jgi:hypothetical protein
MAIVVMMRFLSQIAMLYSASSNWTWRTYTWDSHAQDYEGGRKNECKISEELKQRSREWSNEIPTMTGANAQIQPSTIPVTVTGSVRVPINSDGNQVPLTLQFKGSVASNPTNIAMIATRAVRRQPEYSFAPAHDQWHVRERGRRALPILTSDIFSSP